MLTIWYHQNHRDLPWRKTNDPYAIWVSEVMLQQTRVETVLRYFPEWMTRFPTLQALAKANQMEVLKCWEGLGYYGRARNLHMSAKIIDQQLGGKIPDDPSLFQTLPGVGQYICSAVMSIAFDLQIPVLDGNVKRVVSRFFGIRSEISTSLFKKDALNYLNKNILGNKPGIFNQAMMELGATVCLPKNPHCENCPISPNCYAFKNEKQKNLPNVKKRNRPPHFDVTAGIIYRGKNILIAQRPQDGMLGGLWEFPGGKKKQRESLNTCLVREVREELQLKISVGEKFQIIKHAYSHFKITLHVFECYWISGKPQTIGCTDFRWVTLSELDNFPFPATDLQIIQKLLRINKEPKQETK